MKKKVISILLLLCMLVSLVPAMAFAAGAEDTAIDEAAINAASETEEGAAAADAGTKECDFKSVINAKLYVKANKEAGLDGDVVVDFTPLTCKGTLYLPGSADTDNLYLSWDNEALVVSKNGIAYENGTAPVAPDSGTAIYNISKGKVSVNVMIKTVKGSSEVEGMFLNIDESLGTIDAMNSDPDHETLCYGKMSMGEFDTYMSMKGRGNSTWVFEKKPYNVTLFKKSDYDKKNSLELIDGVKSKKWSLLANHLDSSLLRNKVAFDLAKALGIGLDSKFVDLWMNGEYLGCYMLTPKKDYIVPDNGFIIENDHIPDDTNPNQFKFPNIEEMPGKHNMLNVEEIGDDAAKAGWDLAKVQDWFGMAWDTVLDYDSEDYQNYFDLDSWAKMYLMFEVSKTYDCYAGNIIMHRDGLTDGVDKLMAGPAWDYDIAFGRTLHKFLVGVTEPVQLNAEGWYNDSVGMVVVKKPYSILQGLGMHESFMKRVTELYNDYKAEFEDLVPNVDRQRAVIEASALMNNVRWGTHHLGADYLVAPTTMSVLGAGKYRLNYEVTVNWDSYVNNLKEYCAKRVMWMSDHLYAEYPEGSITQAIANGDSIVLKAKLTAGNKDNTYQWQSSADGKNWADIEGATNATLTLALDENNNGVQYRCIVKNAGVKISTTHGGTTKASAQTILDPVTVNVTMAEDEAALSEGEFTLVLNGRDMGEFTFAEASNGWTIRNAEGQYVAAMGLEVVLSDSQFTWNYKDGVFVTNSRVTFTTLGKLLGLSTNQAVYLTQSGNELTVSLSKGAPAQFLVRYPVLEQAVTEIPAC